MLKKTICSVLPFGENGKEWFKIFSLYKKMPGIN